MGGKTRANKPTWVDLLNTNWACWADRTIAKHGDAQQRPDWKHATRERVKDYWLLAIGVADMDDLARLDGLYCDEQLEKRWK